jgi:hypothetical protein
MQPKFIFFEISLLISHVKHDFRPNFNEFSENRRYCHLRILFCYCPQARTSSSRRGGAELLRYLEAFARLFDLHRLVWFETEVVRIRREPGSGWAVALMKLGEKGSGEEEVYNAVVVCIGHYMEPRIATIPGKFRRHTGRGSVGARPRSAAGGEVTATVVEFRASPWRQCQVRVLQAEKRWDGSARWCLRRRGEERAGNGDAVGGCARTLAVHTVGRSVPQR